MKESTKKMIVGGFFAFLMIASIAGFALNFVSGGGNVQKYNGFKFVYRGQNWQTQINGKTHDFFFFPGELEYITLAKDVNNFLKKDHKVITVTYDQNSTIASNLAEAQYILEQELLDKITVTRALTNNTGTQLPKADCVDATEKNPVIKLAEGNESIVKLENNCLTLQAVNLNDLYETTERISYAALGVMNG